MWRVSIKITLPSYFEFKKIFYLQTQEDLNTVLAKRWPHYVVIDIEGIDNFSNGSDIINEFEYPLKTAEKFYVEHLKKCRKQWVVKNEVSK